MDDSSGDPGPDARQARELRKVLKALKKSFKTNGTLVQDEELGTILQLQGDFRAEVGEFLLDQGFSDKDHLKIHGV